MQYTNTPNTILLFIFIFLHCAHGGAKEVREQERILEHYENLETTAIVDNVRNDLLSKDALLQDAGCIILLKTLQRLKESDRNAEFIFTRLSGDEKVVFNAADIIDSRLLGWYNSEKSEENDDGIQIYIPLFHILGKADNKTARGTLVRSFLYLRNRKDILEGIPMNEELAVASLKKLKIIEDKLCCLYPGKDFVIPMLEKDSRFSMLDIFGDLLMANKNISERMIKKIKDFIISCMEYGDSKNGHLIRIRAVKIAGILLAKGIENDLALKIAAVAKNDPYYVHKFNGTTGYSMTELKYPVRETSSKILLSAD